MSDSYTAVPDTGVMQLIVPDSVLTRTDPGPFNQALTEKIQKDTQLVSGLMFIDKVEKEKIIKEQTPIWEKGNAKKQVLLKQILAKARKAVAGLKDDDTFKAVKAAMDVFGINVRCSVAFVNVDMQERGSNAITYKNVVENIDKKSTYRTDAWTTEDLTMEFTDSMKALQTQYWEQFDIVEEAQDKIVKANAQLENRANRMADAQGVVALNNMSDAEKARVKALYATYEEKDITKLLGVGK